MPRTRSLAWSELKVGILAIAAVVIAVMLVLAVGGEGGFFWQRYGLRTRFPDAQGLKAGAVVRLSGLEVGSVSYVRFEGADVEVGFEVREEFQSKITTDSRATIGSLSLLGEATVDVSASATGDPVPEGGLVRAADLTPDFAEVSLRASEGLTEMTDLIRGLREGRGTMGRLLTDEQLYVDLRAFVQSAEAVTSRIGSGDGTLGRLVRDPTVYAELETSLKELAAITARIRSGEGSLGKLVNDDAFATSLSGMTANLEDMTARIRRGEGTAGKLVQDSALYDRLDSLSARLDRLIGGLNAGEGSAGQMLRDGRLYENMNTTVQELRTLITDIRSDPKKFLNVRVSIF